MTLDGDKKEETRFPVQYSTCRSALPSGTTHRIASGTQGAENGTQSSTNPQALDLQGNASSSTSNSHPTSSSARFPSSGEENETGKDNDSDIASSLGEVDFSNAEIGVARTVNYVHVGPARLVDIAPRSNSNQLPAEPHRNVSAPLPAGVNQTAPWMRYGRPRLASMLSSDDLRRARARAASANVGPSPGLPASATSPALNQPLPAAPSPAAPSPVAPSPAAHRADPLSAYVEQDNQRVQDALRRYGRRFDEIQQNDHRQRQIDEARRHQMNVDRAQYERRQVNKSRSTPQLYIIPHSDDGASTASSTSANRAGPSNAQDTPPSYEYERQIRRMGGMIPLNVSA